MVYDVVMKDGIHFYLDVVLIKVKITAMITF